MKEFTDVDFKKTGKGYGKQITYITLTIASLVNSFRDIGKLTGEEISKAKNIKEELENIKIEMIKKNNTIYHDVILEVSHIPKIQKVIKVSPSSSLEDLNQQNIKNNIMDDLIPKEAKSMVEKYKQQMNDFIYDKLDKQETDLKINNFLNEMNLHFSLDNATNNDISESFWKRISDIQQKGGILFITNKLSNVQLKTNEIMNILSDMELKLLVKI